ncbi:MAG: copper amine oxidase N-terminal domain-containing protein [Clostridia bacterium]|nr:copper amine oxidase N-terminal domain-containing protein [Clostridia bacterium]
MWKERVKGFIAGGIVVGLLSTSGFAAPVRKNITAVYDKIKIFINGADKTPYQEEMKPFIVNGRTFISLRYASEVLGKKVLWNSATKSVFISDTGNTKEDVYFYTQPYIKSDKNLVFDSGRKLLYCEYNLDVWGGTNVDKVEDGKGYVERKIVYNMDGLSKKVFGTLKMIDDSNGIAEGKVTIYNEKNVKIYESPFIRKSSLPQEFSFNTSGVRQMKVVFRLQSDTDREGIVGKLAISDFRYSK